MVTAGNRVLIVSERFLFSQGIKSLLEDSAGIASVQIVEDMDEALDRAHLAPPSALVIDMPPGSSRVIDRPVTVNDEEVRTIILREMDEQTRMYVHAPGEPANIRNLLAAILRRDEDGGDIAPLEKEGDLPQAAANLVHELPEPSQPISLMIARASGPSRSRRSASKPRS